MRRPCAPFRGDWQGKKGIGPLSVYFRWFMPGEIAFKIIRDAVGRIGIEEMGSGAGFLLVSPAVAVGIGLWVEVG